MDCNIDKSGFTFNPSVSAMVFPEQTTNFVRGQGFRSNNGVLRRFVANGDKQGALNHFGFEGKYNPDLKSKNYQSEDYWGATNSKTGKVSYGNLAFEDYSTLYGTYMKESYTSRKILSGMSIKKLPSELQGLGMDTYLEEIYGYIYVYRNQGLFKGTIYLGMALNFIRMHCIRMKCHILHNPLNINGYIKLQENGKIYYCNSH